MAQKQSVIDEYFIFQRENTEKYGHKTIVFMEIGKFYEAYEKNNAGYNLIEISKALEIKYVKKKVISEDINLHMLGFPVTSIVDKLKILIDNGFTVVLVNQITNSTITKNTQKILRKVCSSCRYRAEGS